MAVNAGFDPALNRLGRPMTSMNLSRYLRWILADPMPLAHPLACAPLSLNGLQNVPFPVRNRHKAAEITIGSKQVTDLHGGYIPESCARVPLADPSLGSDAASPSSVTGTS